MVESGRDKLVFDFAKKYLADIPGVTKAIVEVYMEPEPQPGNIPGVYRRLLESAQNAGSMPNVIGKSIPTGFSGLSRFLSDLDPKSVHGSYPNRKEFSLKLLNDMKEKLTLKGQVNDGAHSLWVRFCGSIIEGAEFLSQFEDSKDFYEWVKFFDDDERAREALPLLLKTKIHGFGFALACDFLKELGYINFGKPDVHIKNIFSSLNLADNKEDHVVLEAIQRIAKNNETDAYAVDKVFWLIGSGKFYKHKQCIGVNGRTGSHRKPFIEFVKSNGI